MSKDKNVDFSEINNLPYVIVCTTRPETILGDTAICVNPLDSRFFDIDKIFKEKQVSDLFNEIVQKSSIHEFRDKSEG